MVIVPWDYTDRAVHYDKRADYSESCLAALFQKVAPDTSHPLADLGAGTGKLTLQLLHHGYTVSAIEPNDNMRAIGIDNTQGLDVTWRDGTGENTGLSDCTYQAAFFGSSFNVMDHTAALSEVSRILVPGGWFCCMWNHRDLADPIQSSIELIIKSYISEYDYGSRRNDPTASVDTSGLFKAVENLEASFITKMPREDVITAWKSHATLARQAGDKFGDIIAEIETLIGDALTIEVPYTTRVWCAALKG